MGYILMTNQWLKKYPKQFKYDDRADKTVNPVLAHLKPQDNRPSYSNTVIAVLAVDG